LAACLWLLATGGWLNGKLFEIILDIEIVEFSGDRQETHHLKPEAKLKFNVV
jgi:hypothetical protein